VLGNIKDALELCDRLLKLKKFREYSSSILSIQTIISQTYKENACLQERNIQLVSENLHLKEQYLKLETDYLALKGQPFDPVPPAISGSEHKIFTDDTMKTW
jgi:hypothetical protein